VRSELAEPLLVGREQELELLLKYLDLAFKGKGTTVFVSGEAGIGKTRLFTAFTEFAREKNANILSGWCLSNASIPYFPFIEALSTHESENKMVHDSLNLIKAKSSLLFSRPSDHSEAFDEERWMTPQTWKEQAFAAITKDLLLMSSGRPTILLIEDIHWADSASLALLHYISKAAIAERILILASFRKEELDPPNEGQPNPLVDTLRLMEREDLYKEISLSTLTEGDVAKVTESMLRGKVSSTFIKRLSEESQGNPLYIVESIRMLHESRSLVNEKGIWQVSTESLILPEKVKYIILRRMSTLRNEERRVLDAASVIGDKFDSKLLQSVLGISSIRILEILNAIAHCNKIVCSEKAFFRFDHARSREVIYNEIFPPLRTGYHERIAEIIESQTNLHIEQRAATLAYHFAKAENKSKAIDFSLQAGQDALSRFANQEAMKFFTYVIENADDPYAEKRAISLEGLGDALLETGRELEALKAFQEAYEHSKSDLVRLRALRKAICTANYQGDVATIQRLLKKAQEIPSVDELEVARIKLYQGSVARLDEATSVIEGALRVFEAECSVQDIIFALIELGISYAEAGRLEESLLASFRALELSKNSDDRSKVLIFGHISFCLLACGFLDEALDYASKGIAIGEKIENVRTAWIHVFASSAYYYKTSQKTQLKQYPEASNLLNLAISHSKKASSIAEKTEGHYITISAYGLLINQLIAAGIISEALEYEEKLDKLLIKIGPHFDTAILRWVHTAKASLSAIKENWKEANKHFELGIESHKSETHGSIFEGGFRLAYSGALAKQQRFAEAKIQFEKGTQIIREIKARFSNSKVLSSIIVPAKVLIGKEFNVRLDIVNVTNKSAYIEEMKGLENFEMVEVSTSLLKSNTSQIDLKKTKLNGFQVLPVKLKIKAKKTGTFSITIKVSYIDNLDNRASVESNSKSLTVYSPVSSQSLIEQQNQSNLNSQEFEFNSSEAKLAFGYLVAVFIQDYMQRKIVVDKAGWKSLMDLVKNGRVARASVYNPKGGKGKAIVELERRGLIETSYFPGQRGRGGKILRVKINYENELLKNYIHNRIMKNK
jgi:tetratricopeptide (TPR) repeat protein